jgi:hypothetical protein
MHNLLFLISSLIKIGWILLKEGLIPVFVCLAAYVFSGSIVVYVIACMVAIAWLFRQRISTWLEDNYERLF